MSKYLLGAELFSYLQGKYLKYVLLKVSQRPNGVKLFVRLNNVVLIKV